MNPELDATLGGLKYEWTLLARKEQLPPPGNWRSWMVCAGRGFGKTRCGAEWVRARVESGEARNVIIAGPTAGDVRDVMVEGESGLLAVSPPWFKPHYEPSKARITWPNGATAVLLPAEEPERFRGKQGDTVWCDELASWYYPEAWDLLQFAVRLGSPRFMVTTTPKPTKLIRELMRDPRTVVTRGSTFDNAANLAADFVADIRLRYEGTRLGRQELFAEILDDVPGALWQRDAIDRLRVLRAPHDIVRVVVAVDPSGGAGDGNDAQGIVVAARGADGHAYVLADRTCKLTPDGWGRAAVKAYQDFNGDRIVGEKNFGGDMVGHVIQTAARSLGLFSVPFTTVTASRGKVQRAEPVAALYEQGRVHHVGCFNELEDELCRFVPGADFDESPNRADALVFALTELMLGESKASFGAQGFASPQFTFSVSNSTDDDD